MSNAKEEVVIINNTPLTPRKRGAEIASVENYSLALELWREACAGAGLAFFEDNCTTNGARKVAARYLDTNALTPEAIRKAMQNLAYLITHDKKASHYTLNALGRNISRYLEAPKKAVQPPSAKQIRWRWTCDKCGTDAVDKVPRDVTPPPVPCTKAKWGWCDGTAYPECEGGTH